MASIRTKSLDEPDEVRHFPFMDSQLAQIGSIGVWRWSTSIGPVTGDALCQVHHISLVLVARIAFRTEEGDVADIGPDTLV